MKNLKRVLSLALATVMLLGMMVVGANAAFADQADIKYTAAVDTLVQLGVINGMTETTFVPNGTLTRAQGAKLAAYIKAGANEATISYYDGTTKFTDVKSNHSWATGSINYCVANGIISGMTDKTYGPDSSLTGAQLAKMMLVALGYPEKSENANQTLEGANWQLNAIRMATEAGLFKGLDNTFAATRAITRQEAAQVMYNALFLNTWRISEYQNATPVYKNDGAPLIQTAFNSSTGTPASGAYGRPSTQYTFTDGKDAITIPQIAKVTYTGAVTEGKIMADLGLTGTFSTGTGKVLVSKVDGAAGSVASLDRAKVNTTTDVVAGTGAGVLTEVYMDKDAAGTTTVTIVSINTYLGKVSTVRKANATTGVPASTSIAVDGKSTLSFETEAFAKDAMVMVTLDNGVIKTVDAAKSTVATVTAKNTTRNTVTAGGTTYSFNKTALKSNTDFNLSGSYTLYLDNYGNLLGADVYSAVSNIDVVYVDGASVVATADGIEGVSATVKVRVNYMNGSTEILPIEVKTATATTGHGLSAGDKYITIQNGASSYEYKKIDTTTASAVQSALNNQLFSYTKKDGNIQLSSVLSTTGVPATTAAVQKTTGDALTLSKGNAAMGGSNFASTTTKITLVKDGSVVTYTGYANFPSKTYTVGTDNVTAIVTIKTGDIVSEVLVLGGAAATSATPDVYAYYLGAGDVTSDGQYHDFYVNGEVKSYLLADGVSATASQAAGLFLDSKGVVTSVTAGQAAAEITTVGDGFVVIGGQVYYTSNTTVVYNVVTEGVCVADTLAKGDQATFVFHTDPVSSLKMLDAAFITVEG